MAAITKNSTFDPYTQNITILMADGVTPLQVSIADIDESALYNVQVSINVAAQFGASLIMLIVVLLLTKSAKRKSPLFMVNVLSLALSTIRALLAALYFTSAWTELYAEFSGDYSAIPRSAYTNSIAAIVMSLLLLCTIEISLIIQTKVVCTTLKDSYKFAVLAVSVLIALLAVAFRFAFTVENAITILDAESSIDTVWLYSASLITETISIWYFSAIFVAKLGYTLFQRRKLGLRQWGPMQIVCIMGGCTLIIPCK
jgi:pheromone alpha factor receptor